MGLLNNPPDKPHQNKFDSLAAVANQRWHKLEAEGWYAPFPIAFNNDRRCNSSTSILK